jgi:lysophospholipase L1-like esterase
MREVNEQIRDYNQLNEQLFYLDTATPLLKNERPDPDLLQDDGLHLNEAGYAIWNARLIEMLKRLLN